MSSNPNTPCNRGAELAELFRPLMQKQLTAIRAFARDVRREGDSETHDTSAVGIAISNLIEDFLLSITDLDTALTTADFFQDITIDAARRVAMRERRRSREDKL